MINAEVHSDDRVFEINFDATSWARVAKDYEIQALRDCGYGFDIGADAVAIHFEESNEEIKAMFAYIQAIKNTRKACGFECSVNQVMFESWIRENRPELSL